MTEAGTGAARTVPYDRFRRVIARRLSQSVTTKPHVTLHRYAAVDRLEDELAAARTRLGAGELSLTATVLALVARAMRHDGRLNGTVSEQAISLQPAVHLGVAVDVDGALVVPVVRDADARSVASLAAELSRLADAARSGGLSPDETANATFTVTSLGAHGVELFTPVINPPELAILGVGAVSEHVASTPEGFAVRRRIGLSLSFDHAATDGAAAARVLCRICTSLEEDAHGLPWTDDDLQISRAPTSATAP